MGHERVRRRREVGGGVGGGTHGIAEGLPAEKQLQIRFDRITGKEKGKGDDPTIEGTIGL